MRTVIGIMAMVFVVSQVWSATIIVDQNDPTADFQAIGPAINAANTDDTILVRSGRYQEHVSVNKGLKLIGAGPATCRIEATGSGITWWPPAGTTGEIRGFYIRASGEGIGVSQTDFTLKIRNNVIANCGSHGIKIMDGGGIFQVVNNVIVRCEGEGVWQENAYMGSPQTVTYYNNVICNNSKHGLLRNEGTAMLLYNDVFGNLQGNYSGVSAGAHDITLDPKFVNADVGNFLFRLDSPCLFAGAPDLTFRNPDGTRNHMGYYGGPDAAPFWPFKMGAPAITDLTVQPAVLHKGETLTIRARGQAQ